MERSSAVDDEGFVGFSHALEVVRGTVGPMAPVAMPVWDCAGWVLARSVTGRVDTPSVDASLRDGYAVVSSDFAGSDVNSRRELTIVGLSTAGRGWGKALSPGEAVAITTGAPVPAGADAVVASELCSSTGDDRVVVQGDIRAGLNVLLTGADSRMGEIVGEEGTCISPGLAGMMAAAGLESVMVFGRPRIAVIAVGDEMVRPGEKLGHGQLYASNLVTMTSWLGRMGFESVIDIVPDEASSLSTAVDRALESCDVIITSGGAWRSSRDMVIPLFERRGWDPGFLRVRMGPGKGTAFGMDGGKPVFCLPGGPPSNEAAFLELVVPGIRAMSGHGGPPFPLVTATYRGPPVVPRGDRWTRFERVSLKREEEDLVAVATGRGSRLAAMADTDGMLVMEEGAALVEPGRRVRIQWLLQG